MDGIEYLGGYDGILKDICKGLKCCLPRCYSMANDLFDLMIPEGSVIIPMPCHLGMPRYMNPVAQLLCENGKRELFPFLHCVPHESHYEVKKRGEIPEEPSMFIAEGMELPKGKDIYIIDNVISSGATARAALKAIPNATVVALAK